MQTSENTACTCLIDSIPPKKFLLKICKVTFENIHVFNSLHCVHKVSFENKQIYIWKYAKLQLKISKVTFENMHCMVQLVWFSSAIKLHLKISKVTYENMHYSSSIGLSPLQSYIWKYAKLLLKICTSSVGSIPHYKVTFLVQLCQFDCRGGGGNGPI